MLRATILAVIAVGVLAGTASAGQPDPRVCLYGPTRKADCAKRAAVLAVRKTMAARTGHPGTALWTSDLTCSTKSAKFLVWSCRWSLGSATVTFRALSSGWHTSVTVRCADPAMEPSCARKL